MLEKENGENLYLVDESVKNVAMKLRIWEAQILVWTLHREYLLTLEAAGYGNLTESKLHIAIRSILSRLKPHLRNSRMKIIIMWGTDEEFDKKDFNAFM